MRADMASVGRGHDKYVLVVSALGAVDTVVVGKRVDALPAVLRLGVTHTAAERSCVDTAEVRLGDGLNRIAEGLDLQVAAADQGDCRDTATGLPGTKLLCDWLHAGANGGTGLFRQFGLGIEPAALDRVDGVGATFELGEPDGAIGPGANAYVDGRTFPGFIRPSGSMASLMRRIISSVSASCSSGRYPTLP